MSERTGIEWAHHTFNIVWGCVKVSPGCQHCYAEKESRRRGFASLWGPAKTTGRRTFGDAYWQKPLRWDRAAARAGERRRVFCSSMADVFEDHPAVDAERAKLWPLIQATPHLDWLILTKRPERIAGRLPDDWSANGWPNVWLGTSLEADAYWMRVLHLTRVPAVVHFLSLEPLLLPVACGALPGWFHIEWVIAGGESGPKARPCYAEWLRTIRDDCARYDVPFFLKQLGGYPDKRGGESAVLDGLCHVALPTPRAAVRS